MSLILTGLDGANPLGFLAALGVQRALTDRGVAVKMRWVDDGGWRPELQAVDSFDEVVALLEQDLATWRQEPALDLIYPARDKKTGEQKIDKKTHEEIMERDLKPLPEEYAEYLRKMRALGGRSEQLALAFASDVGIDRNGYVKPTALHFLAAQQRFLKMAIKLRDGVTSSQMREAVKGPWLDQDDAPVFGWNPTSSRMHALRAFDPSPESKTGTAGAEWLAFIGLRSLPTVPSGPGSNITTGSFGSWKRGRFCWPIWNVPLSADAVCSAVQQMAAVQKMKRAATLDAAALNAWGIIQVFESTIHRADSGGLGSFSPPSVIH